MVKYIIHTERIWNDNNWNNLIKFLKRKKSKACVMLMPPQFTYQYAVLGYRGNRRELVRILRERYDILRRGQSKYNYYVGILLNFSYPAEELNEDEKKDGIRYGFRVINSIFGNPNDPFHPTNAVMISFGNENYDEYMEELCIRNGLHILHDGFGKIKIYDYELPLSHGLVIKRYFGVLWKSIKRIFGKFLFKGNKRLKKLEKQVKKERKEKWKNLQKEKSSN
jgi:hypothetical protein